MGAPALVQHLIEPMCEKKQVIVQRIYCKQVCMLIIILSFNWCKNRRCKHQMVKRKGHLHEDANDNVLLSSMCCVLFSLTPATYHAIHGHDLKIIMLLINRTIYGHDLDLF